MKEFDKIYIAKYEDILSLRQISEDLETNKNEVEESLNEIKSNGLYEVYKNMSDYEWERLENKTDFEILNTYLPKTKGYYLKIFGKIVAEFKLDIAEEAKEVHKYKFEIYKPEDYILSLIIFKKKILRMKNGNKLAN